MIGLTSIMLVKFDFGIAVLKTLTIYTRTILEN